MSADYKKLVKTVTDNISKVTLDPYRDIIIPTNEEIEEVYSEWIKRESTFSNIEIINNELNKNYAVFECTQFKVGLTGFDSNIDLAKYLLNYSAYVPKIYDFMFPVMFDKSSRFEIIGSNSVRIENEIITIEEE